MPGRISIATFAAALLAAAPAFAQTAPDLDALVKAAKEEGTVNIYSAATDNVARRVTEAFSTKFGIKAQYLRLGSTPLITRYSAEAQSGSIAADLMFLAGGAPAFSRDGIKNGWFEQVANAGIPALKSDNFPTQFLRDGGAIVQIAPWEIVYNTDRVKGGDIPKDWKDVLSPRFKERILLVEPAAADSYLDVWAILRDTYGPTFFASLLDQKPRWYKDGVPAVQALAAGEGDLEFPAVRFLAQASIDRGAPIDTLLPDPTSGVEMYLILTERTKAKHPNAARLFAHYVMSQEGNKVFNADQGSYSVYDTSRLPKAYSSPKPETAARKAELHKLLGY